MLLACPPTPRLNEVVTTAGVLLVEVGGTDHRGVEEEEEEVAEDTLLTPTSKFKNVKKKNLEKGLWGVERVGGIYMYTYRQEKLRCWVGRR